MATARESTHGQSALGKGLGDPMKLPIMLDEFKPVLWSARIVFYDANWLEITELTDIVLWDMAILYARTWLALKSGQPVEYFLNSEDITVPHAKRKHFGRACFMSIERLNADQIEDVKKRRSS